MSGPVEPGRFLGKTVRKRHVGDLLLADVRYPAGARLPRHTHERAYFCLILDGSYRETYARRTRVCRPGMVVFHPPGEPHTQSMDSRVVTSFNVELGPGWLQRMKDCDLPVDQPAESEENTTVELAVQLFRALHGVDQESLTVESLTADILSTLGRIGSRPAAEIPCWLRDAPALIAAHLQRPPALRTLAAEAGVHPVYFAAAFRRFYGCSLGEYARRCRLDYVRRRIAVRDVPLAQIAVDAGFADQSHLTRTFKRFTGVTPGEYRTFLAFKTR